MAAIGNCTHGVHANLAELYRCPEQQEAWEDHRVALYLGQKAGAPSVVAPAVRPYTLEESRRPSTKGAALPGGWLRRPLLLTVVAMYVLVVVVIPDLASRLWRRPVKGSNQ